MFKVQYKFAKTDNFTMNGAGPYLTREDADMHADRLRGWGLTQVKVSEVPGVAGGWHPNAGPQREFAQTSHFVRLER